jgi:hypothetical protein
MGSLIYSLYGTQSVQKRRVFFSFHYQNDIWRANQVRNSWRYRHEANREAEGFFDASIWERSKRTSDDALKQLIRDGLKNTSVTCVLAGAETYRRRWVRYEIARSIVKANGLLTVRIHNLQNQNNRQSVEGYDPLDYMGVYKVNDGRILLAEKSGNKWVRYSDYTQSVSLPTSWQKPTTTSVIPLSRYANSYCYVLHGGSRNFSSWVRQAASHR